jgi:hypothetical protein
MTHWKSLQDEKEWLYAHDLNGRDVVVEIASVVAGEITGEQGKKSRKPIASFVNAKKKLALNATNCKTLATLLGSNNVEDWVGKAITLYPTTTTWGGQTVDCIRVRPKLPTPRKEAP